MTATTINPRPVEGSSFFNTLDTFLLEEDADRFKDIHQSFVATGGLGATIASLTHTPTSLTAYPGGHFITETGSITYPDDATHIWVICHKDTTTAITDWTRESGTHYLFRNTGSGSKPTPPTDSTILMKVTTASGSITNVDDHRTQNPHPYQLVAGNDSAAIQAAIDALPVSGGRVLLAGQTYSIDANVTGKSNITIEGVGPSTILMLEGGASALTGLTFTGTLGTAVNLTANSLIGDITIAVAGGDESGFTASGYAHFLDTPGDRQTVKVVSTASGVITVNDPIAVDFTTANTATIAPMTPVSNFSIRNLTLDGNNNTGTNSNLIKCTHIVNATIENIWCKGTTGSAIRPQIGYNCRINNIILDDCGSSGQSDIQMGLSNSIIDNIQSSQPSGFGPQMNGSAYCNVSNMTSVGAAGRSLKFDRCDWNNFVNLQAHNPEAGSTGISVSTGSDNNSFTNCLVVNAPTFAYWIQAASSNNKFFNCRAIGSGSKDILFDTNSDDNQFWGFNGDTPILVSSGSNNIVQRWNGTTLEYMSFDDSAAAGPIESLKRVSTTAADNDILGKRTFEGRTDTSNEVTYAEIQSAIIDATNATRTGDMEFYTLQSAVRTLEMWLNGGLIISNATGSGKGVGSINMKTELYRQGTQVITARQTGWAATTGVEIRTNFGDASLSDTSQALRALIVDLKTHGVIGA
ncbi:hypothetical protein LCGC14_0690140 [marine sediment metagenome]|uniref:Pectate lyase superfamily protein domain-containing protein n=1 Tax=marine sediment metagenome TaxID=412755 RepID=A0A0F9QKQ9_9ZZZZ